MKAECFIKRLNATEIGIGVTNDTYIAIPREVDLSSMLVNQQAMTIFDRVEGVLYTPDNSNIKYVQTGQNNQERISGLGQYFRNMDAHVGDEVVIERVVAADSTKLYLDFHHRNVVVFQKNRDWVELLTPELLIPYKQDDDYMITVTSNLNHVPLHVRYLGKKKKKATSPSETDAYDLIIGSQSVLPQYDYLDFIEINTEDVSHRMARMKSYIFSILSTDEFDGGEH